MPKANSYPMMIFVKKKPNISLIRELFLLDIERLTFSKKDLGSLYYCFMEAVPALQVYLITLETLKFLLKTFVF
ncbi:hypothetical protein LEP1GSC050_0658 [Leptospira broomii serovar Hurstbridge str. 5399]|uniref:Uncharacterized protein n=1 Tax=Leptospira broomii serovar Hurstbridge str. 5399 TaxID=1049789 RepID=T0GMY0_9LEPT|nr:hypothetical protein LEP1GSC050_0658 [Leptospira broomii serovar Hurstbridge str. 5399]